MPTTNYLRQLYPGLTDDQIFKMLQPQQEPFSDLPKGSSESWKNLILPSEPDLPVPMAPQPVVPQTPKVNIQDLIGNRPQVGGQIIPPQPVQPIQDVPASLPQPVAQPAQPTQPVKPTLEEYLTRLKEVPKPGLPEYLGDIMSQAGAAMATTPGGIMYGATPQPTSYTDAARQRAKDESDTIIKEMQTDLTVRQFHRETDKSVKEMQKLDIELGRANRTDKLDQEAMDPNSSLSKRVRDMFNQVGVKVPETASYSDIKQFAPEMVDMIKQQISSAATLTKAGVDKATDVKKVLDGVRKDWEGDTRIRTLKEQLDAATQLEDLVFTNPYAARGSMIKLARAIGDKGTLSDMDIKRWTQRPGLKGWWDKAYEFAASDLTPELKQAITDVAQEMKSGLTREINSEAMTRAKTVTSPTLYGDDITPDEVLSVIRPELKGQPNQVVSQETPQQAKENQITRRPQPIDIPSDVASRMGEEKPTEPKVVGIVGQAHVRDKSTGKYYILPVPSNAFNAFAKTKLAQDKGEVLRFERTK